MAGNFERMKAARLFAAELKTTTIEVPKKGGDQYESQLYLTQTGAKAARVMPVSSSVSFLLENYILGSDTIIDDTFDSQIMDAFDSPMLSAEAL